jgi:hypothetical protein
MPVSSTFQPLWPQRVLPVAVLLVGSLFSSAFSFRVQALVDPQSKSARTKAPASTVDDGWEFASAKVDQVAVVALGDPPQTIFVVSRRRSGERTSLAWKRLRSARSYLIEKGVPNTLVLADGEPVPDQGRVDFYVGGVLIATVRAARNRSIYFDDGP